MYLLKIEILKKNFPSKAAQHIIILCFHIVKKRLRAKVNFGKIIKQIRIYFVELLY